MGEHRPLSKAYHAVRAGGALPCVLNAANEIAVAAFLKGEISFSDISDMVISAVDSLEESARKAVTLEEILSFDTLGREYVKELISRAK